MAKKGSCSAKLKPTYIGFNILSLLIGGVEFSLSVIYLTNPSLLQIEASNAEDGTLMFLKDLHKTKYLDTLSHVALAVSIAILISSVVGLMSVYLDKQRKHLLIAYVSALTVIILTEGIATVLSISEGEQILLESRLQRQEDLALTFNKSYYTYIPKIENLRIMMKESQCCGWGGWTDFRDNDLVIPTECCLHRYNTTENLPVCVDPESVRRRTGASSSQGTGLQLVDGSMDATIQTLWDGGLKVRVAQLIQEMRATPSFPGSTFPTRSKRFTVNMDQKWNQSSVGVPVQSQGPAPTAQNLREPVQSQGPAPTAQNLTVFVGDLNIDDSVLPDIIHTAGCYDKLKNLWLADIELPLIFSSVFTVCMQVIQIVISVVLMFKQESYQKQDAMVSTFLGDAVPAFSSLGRNTGMAARPLPNPYDTRRTSHTSFNSAAAI